MNYAKTLAADCYPSNGQCETACAPPMSPIEEAIDRLGYELNSLDEAVQRVAHRTATVRIPAPTAVGENCKEKQDRSPLQHVIETTIVKIQNSTRMLHQISSEIQL